MLKLILFFFLVVHIYAMPPSWYLNQSLDSKNYEIIGYGEGKTLDEAKQIAKSDIAKSIQTQLSSSTSINKSLESKTYSKSITQNINEETNILLTNLETINSEYNNNKYYVAIKYINLPFAKKIKVLMGSEKILESKNNYLNKTPLLNELKHEFGFYPKVELSENKLIVNNKSFFLPKKEFVKLFAHIENKSLKMNLKDEYKNAEYYFINVLTNQSGYLNIFQVYESGETAILLSNKKVNLNDKIVFPNPNQYDGLEAIVPSGQDKTKDLTIVALCEDKKDFSLFDKINLIINNKSLLFGKLLSNIENCNIESKVIKIEK
jgi:hypothetical protein